MNYAVEIGSGQGITTDSCEHGNAPSGSTKFWEFFWVCGI
jgi:hypothetical protein